MDRKHYGDKLNGYLTPLGASYDAEGSKKISRELFDLLEGIDKKTKTVRRVVAVKRAKKVHDKHNHKSPSTEESSTIVFRLVEEIIKHI